MTETLLRAAYALALRLATPAFLARLWWRGRREPGYREHLAERLGFGPAEAPGRVWIHAVSLGETKAAEPLIAALRARDPALRLLLTHGTATGRAAARALLREGDRACWQPWDTPGAVRRFLARHRPAVGVVMETEVWPVLLHEAARAGVPLLLANARLSERSARKGRRLAALLHPALARFDAVLAQTEADAARLRGSGARAVRVAGNLKFEIAVDGERLARGAAWKAALGRPVVLAAVTREGEEAALLAAWRAAPRGAALLVVVPRHPQRFDEVAALVAGAGFTLARRSGFAGDAPAGEALRAEVWLGDSLGEMPAWYALADVALLGGSFAPLGGQNLIEAAACGCPLLMGPHTFNFAQAADLAIEAGAARRVDDVGAAVALALRLLHDGPARQAMGDAGRAFTAAHRGAAARMAEAVLAARRA
ncbi:MAG: 3-deoxy-D-manno-octulosonic acid transferase [Betaproteobacteria bacterium]|jgi:3-deoxy-D-manno-octulosonic-acid transferase|nr:3-deoxy-D-manno-octulosonic acid transferase [Rubrivivax sp.]